MWCLLPETHTLIRQNNFAHTPQNKKCFTPSLILNQSIQIAIPETHH